MIDIRDVNCRPYSTTSAMSDLSRDIRVGAEDGKALQTNAQNVSNGSSGPSLEPIWHPIQRTTALPARARASSSVGSRPSEDVDSLVYSSISPTISRQRNDAYNDGSSSIMSRISGESLIVLPPASPSSCPSTASPLNAAITTPSGHSIDHHYDDATAEFKCRSTAICSTPKCATKCNCIVM